MGQLDAGAGLAGQGQALGRGHELDHLGAPPRVTHRSTVAGRLEHHAGGGEQPGILGVDDRDATCPGDP